MRFMLCFVLLSICSGNDPLDEEWEMVLWDQSGVGGMVWEEQPSVSSPQNLTVDENNTFQDGSILSEDLVWITNENISLNFTSAKNILTEGPPTELIDFSIQKEEREFYENLSNLFDNFFNFPNNTTGNPSWSFVTFVTLMPLRCSEVHKVVSLFDTAMRKSNPGSEITSTAQRLGSSVCGLDGVCPCKDVRQYSKRVMELLSTSRTRELHPPVQFPYRVKIEWP